MQPSSVDVFGKQGVRSRMLHWERSAFPGRYYFSFILSRCFKEYRNRGKIGIGKVWYVASSVMLAACGSAAWQVTIRQWGDKGRHCCAVAGKHGKRQDM